MRNWVRVGTQAEFDKVIADGNYAEISDSASVQASGSASVRAYDSASVRAYDSASVQAYGSAIVQAYDSAIVQASGSASVRAYDSASVRAYGSAIVQAYDSASVQASKYCAVVIYDTKVKSRGGVQIIIPEIATAKEWCDFYGVEIKKGVAVLFKGVDDDFSTENARAKKIFYKPGETPIAPDWDGGKAECGGGLHFSPTPGHTLNFNGAAKHFIACPVKVSTIKVHKGAQYPAKCKAPGLCAPCYEVNRQGERIA